MYIQAVSIFTDMKKKRTMRIPKNKNTDIFREPIPCPYRLLPGCFCEYTGFEHDMLNHFIVEHFSPIVLQVKELSNIIQPKDVIVIDDDDEYIIT
jgi:hypothetical protein